MTSTILPLRLDTERYCLKLFVPLSSPPPSDSPLFQSPVETITNRSKSILIGISREMRVKPHVVHQRRELNEYLGKKIPQSKAVSIIAQLKSYSENVVLSGNTHEKRKAAKLLQEFFVCGFKPQFQKAVGDYFIQVISSLPKNDFKTLETILAAICFFENSPQNPLTHQILRSLYKGLLAFEKSPISPKSVEQLVDLMDHHAHDLTRLKYLKPGDPLLFKMMCILKVLRCLRSTQIPFTAHDVFTIIIRKISLFLDDTPLDLKTQFQYLELLSDMKAILGDEGDDFILTFLETLFFRQQELMENLLFYAGLEGADTDIQTKTIELLFNASDHFTQVSALLPPSKMLGILSPDVISTIYTLQEGLEEASTEAHREHIQAVMASLAAFLQCVPSYPSTPLFTLSQDLLVYFHKNDVSETSIFETLNALRQPTQDSQDVHSNERLLIDPPFKIIDSEETFLETVEKLGGPLQEYDHAYRFRKLFPKKVGEDHHKILYDPLLRFLDASRSLFCQQYSPFLRHPDTSWAGIISPFAPEDDSR